MKHEALTARIIGICMKVHSYLGPGLLESVYEEALCRELLKQGFYFRRQPDVIVDYDGEELGIGFRADVIVEETILVELKSVEAIIPIHAKRAITYLRFTGMEVGLLINFNVIHLRDGITRLVLDRRN